MTFVTPVPSGFIVNRSTPPPVEGKREKMIFVPSGEKLGAKLNGSLIAEGELGQARAVGIDDANLGPTTGWIHLEHDPLRVRRPVRDLGIDGRVRQLDAVTAVDVHGDDRFPQSPGTEQVTTFRWYAMRVPSGET